MCAQSQIFTGYGIFRRFNKVPLSSFVPAVLYRVYNRLRGGIILTSHGSLYFNLNRDVRNKDKAIKEQTLFFYLLPQFIQSGATRMFYTSLADLLKRISLKNDFGLASEVKLTIQPSLIFIIKQVFKCLQLPSLLTSGCIYTKSSSVTGLCSDGAVRGGCLM